MPFDVINVLAIFQHLMNNVYREFVNKFIVYYIDDIFICFKNSKELKEYMKLVLQKL